MKRATATVVGHPERHKRQKVTTGARHPQTGQEIVIDPTQAVAINTRPSWTQIIATPAVNEAALDSTSYFSFILENSASGAIEDAMLRFTVQFSTAGEAVPTDSRVMPVHYWFERIEFYDRLTGNEICRLPADIMHLLLNTLSPAVLSSWAEMVNMCPETGRNSNRTWLHGDTQYFYLAITTHTWLSNLDLDLSTLRGDIELRFYPRSTIFVTADQSSLAVPTTAALKEMRLIQSNTQLPSGMKLGQRFAKIGKVHEHKYLDYHYLTDHGRVLYPNEEFTIDLDHFSHKSGALLVYLRKSGAQGVTGGEGAGVSYDPTKGDRLFCCESLGDGGTIDMENLHGKSLLGEGTALDEKFFCEHSFAELVNEKYAAANSQYIIPFSHDLKSMVNNAEMDGYRTLKGDKERLRFKTAAAPRETTATYIMPGSATVPVASNQNRFYIKWDGSLLVSAWTSTGYPEGSWTTGGTNRGFGHPTGAYTHINAMLASHPVQQKNNVKLTLASEDGSDNFNSLTIVATFRDLNDQPKIWDKGDHHRLAISWQDYNAADKHVYEGFISSSTPGRRGFRAGVYDITVYSVYFKSLHEVQGRLETEAI